MSATFVSAFHSEWLKRRRSLGAWLVVVGAFFTPAIVIGARLFHHDRLGSIYADPDFWPALWTSSWESMAIFFLPMAAILATSLVTQIEYRNNAWKQVHALPLSAATIYFSKFAVIVAMLVQFLLLFNVGIALSAFVPWLLTGSTPYPPGPFPLSAFVADTLRYFVDCLPILAIQYLLCLHFRNFLAPIGIGFLGWITGLAMLSSKFAFLNPFAYPMLEYVGARSPEKLARVPIDFHPVAIAYFMVFLLAGLVLFANQRQKG